MLPDGGQSVVDPKKSSVVVSPTTPIVADGSPSASITVTVKGADGSPMSNVPVEIDVSTPDGGQNVLTGTTMPDGTATKLYGTNLVQVATVSAIVKTTPSVTLDDHPTITFIAGPAIGITIVGQPPATVKAGQIMTPGIRIITTDQSGNPSADPSLLVSLRLVHNSSNGVMTGGDATQTVDGGVSFNMLTIDKPQVGYSIRAEVNSGPGSGAADETHLFDVTVGDPSMVTSTLIAMPVNVVADGTSQTTLTVTLRDLGTNPVPGQAIALSVSGTGNTLGADGGVSDATGAFSTTLSSTVAEMKTVTATAAGVSLQTQVTFIP
jgi:adhesin/invasin